MSDRSHEEDPGRRDGGYGDDQRVDERRPRAPAVRRAHEHGDRRDNERVPGDRRQVQKPRVGERSPEETAGIVYQHVPRHEGDLREHEEHPAEPGPPERGRRGEHAGDGDCDIRRPPSGRTVAERPRPPLRP